MGALKNCPRRKRDCPMLADQGLARVSGISRIRCGAYETHDLVKESNFASIQYARACVAARHDALSPKRTCKLIFGRAKKDQQIAFPET
jgi:hypothetical protein